MSRREWRCRSLDCGAVLGRITADGGLVVAESVDHVQAFFDTAKAIVVCFECGSRREFRGRFIVSRHRSSSG